MAFNPASLVDKLAKLNSTQASIETVSEWVQFHRREAPNIVEIWDREFAKAPPPKRLTLLYLANDILQNSRKKGPEYVGAFYNVMPRCLKQALHIGDDRTKEKVARLVGVMDERKVFGNSGARFMKELLAEADSRSKKLSARTGAPVPSNGSAATSAAARLPPALEPVAVALSASDAAGTRSNELFTRCQAVLNKDLIDKGAAADIEAASSLLRDYGAALDAELRQRDAALEALRRIATSQEEGKQQVVDRKGMCQRQLQMFVSRLAQLTGRPEQPSGGAEQPVRQAAGRPVDTSARPDAAAGAAARTDVGAAANGNPSASGGGGEPVRAGSSGGGGDEDEMKRAARALVAELTASGDPKAILEAMAALPQDQQMEIHEQLLQHMGDGPNAAAGSDFGIPADDVYNPDDPAFL